MFNHILYIPVEAHRFVQKHAKYTSSRKSMTISHLQRRNVFCLRTALPTHSAPSSNSKRTRWSSNAAANLPFHIAIIIIAMIICFLVTLEGLGRRRCVLPPRRSVVVLCVCHAHAFARPRSKLCWMLIGAMLWRCIALLEFPNCTHFGCPNQCLKSVLGQCGSVLAFLPHIKTSARTHSRNQDFLPVRWKKSIK